MRGVVADFSRPFRHLFVKLVAPKLYAGCLRTASYPRGMIQAVKQKFSDRPLTGVEIGVFQGTHAKNIIKTLNVETLYLVDPYETYVDSWGFQSSEELENAFFTARRRLKPHWNKVVWVKKKAEEAVENVPDDLDFVYIDGNHNYDSVKRDVELYYLKVKVGGILGGHNFETNHMGVVKAVIEFTVKEGLELNGKGFCDWWIEKK